MFLRPSYTTRGVNVSGATTVWSGLSYVFSKDAVKILSQRRKDGAE